MPLRTNTSKVIKVSEFIFLIGKKIKFANLNKIMMIPIVIVTFISKFIMLKHKKKEPARKYSTHSQMGLKPSLSNIPATTKMRMSHNRIGKPLNNEMLNACREKFLDAGYRKRKIQLQAITTENKKIHQRINSQKTKYCLKELNKSYESNCSLSRRLSQSKISNRQNTLNHSRVSSKNKSQKRQILKEVKSYKIKVQSIKDMKQNELNSFTSIFSEKKPSHFSLKNSKNSKAAFHEKKSSKIELPLIKEKQYKAKVSPLCGNIKESNDLAILHRVEIEMFGSKGKK